MEFVLDCNIWVCGRPRNKLADRSVSRLGAGESALLNSQGCRCCVGQFASQCGVPDDVLLYRRVLQSVGSQSGSETEFLKTAVLRVSHCEDRQLDHELYSINDDTREELPVANKINRIRTVLEQHGHTLKVINEHLIPRAESAN
jgi:hypothetical protein